MIEAAGYAVNYHLYLPNSQGKIIFPNCWNSEIMVGPLPYTFKHTLYMNTMFLQSDLTELAILVEKLKESESVAEKWAAGEDNITDKYAYKYGVMCGRVRALVDAFEGRLSLLNKSLEMQSTKLDTVNPFNA